MEFTTKEDIAAPVEQVYAELTDYERLERQIMRRGVALRRVAEGPGVGMSWQATFGFRGKEREARITLVEAQAPDLLVYDSLSGGLEMRTRLEFVALSRSRTRVTMTADLKPQTLSARLLVQSLKLARGNLEKRFRVRMAEYAKQLEDRLSRA